MLHRVGAPYPWIKRPGMGARVRLNSGSPEMLVVDIKSRSPQVTVSWPDTQGRPVEGVIDYRCLRPA